MTGSVSGLTTSGKNVGSYSLTPTGSLASAENYAIVYGSGTLAITPATLAPSLTGTASKTYDGNTAATLTSSNYSLSGIFSGDSVGVSSSSATYAGKNVGTGLSVSASGLSISGADASNYTLAATSASGNIGAIAPATLAVSLTGFTSKTYDGGTTAALTSSNYNLGGLVAGDSVAANSSAANYAGKNVGTGLSVTASGLSLSGADAGNYTLAATPASGNIGAIVPATLQVSLTGSSSKTYDGTTTASLSSSNYNLSGVVPGDSVTLNDPASGVYASQNAGTGITVSVSGLSIIGGTGAGNYTLANTSAAAIGVITPRPITVTAVNTGKQVGQSDPALTDTITAGSLAAGESLTGSPTRLAGDLPGAYKIAQGTVAASANYSLTFVDGVLTVMPVAPPISELRNTVSTGNFTSEANGPGTSLTLSAPTQSCANGQDCANLPYPANQKIAANIFFVGQ
jgi:hypothetical protein